MSSPTTFPRDAWAQLRRLTPARIALGRVGTSLPTAAHLDFHLAHAQARDAVHLAFDPVPLQAVLDQRGRTSILLHSAAMDRHAYLQRPELGRRLADDAATHLRGLTAVHGGGQDVVVVVADGLSALAVHPHAAHMLEQIDALAAHEDTPTPHTNLRFCCANRPVASYPAYSSRMKQSDRRCHRTGLPLRCHVRFCCQTRDDLTGGLGSDLQQSRSQPCHV